ncbi:V-snare-domain-containing protein [Hesseltinella vesiculosa]|uniref:V-snare-domain-containing protein n=1 Tax=Hesseltinella vesiculosa TaxID=101127 RepID=A0A1X2G447_9FUNG|nr:V-snare-domain-containing protein [Hesseltinella vesiculosa]
MNASELFDNYQQDFDTLFESISSKIHNLIPSYPGDERKKTINAAERELDEVDEVLEQMEMEMLSLPANTRSLLHSQYNTNKAEAEKLKEELRGLEAHRELHLRQELFGDLESQMGNDADFAHSDQRQRLLSGTDRLGESSRRLEESHRLALETEGVGASILSTLKGQRETMTKARDTLVEADVQIERASRTLKTMARRIATNKYITGAIILLLAGLIVLVVFSKLF